jgi:hypothetical protein
VTRATKETTAGKRYLDLQREARRTGRPTDELIQLYALECFLDRLESWLGFFRQADKWNDCYIFQR